MIDFGFITIVTGLVALNALFVAAEFAIVGTPRTAIDQLASTGSARAATVARVLREPARQDRYIATAQLGITIASLGLGMYAEPRLASAIANQLALTGAPAWLASHALAGVTSLIILTYLHIVLGEMVPKAVALAQPLRAALWLTPLMLVVQTATYPLVAVLNGFGNGLLRTVGVERRLGNVTRTTADELHHIVRDAERGGMLGSEAADVIDELIHFGELTAREVMVPRVKIRGIEVGAGFDEIAVAVTLAPHARYPVFARDLDHIVGMIHIKDIARRASERSGLRQAEILPIPFVPGSATLDTVLEAMRNANAQMAVVMDEHGGTDGIVTTEDLFEEVVGDIPDATSGALPDLHVDEAGVLHAAGTVRIEELGEHLDRPLEHEEVDTVSGLVLSLLDRPPQVGDRVRYDGIELEVAAVTGRGVADCRVAIIGPAAPADEESPESSHPR
ncbi:MAG TPA: hemolysin family protein [Kofleriaceae bacterium]|nr:hemolysin family protein [Kofleriaceae bacterium]